MAIKGFLLVVVFCGFCAPPSVRYFWVFVPPPFWNATQKHSVTQRHRHTDTQIPQIPRDPDVQDVLPPHQRVDLVFREPVPWWADPASLDGFGDECWGLLPEFSHLLVCELVFGEVGETSGFMW